MFIFSDSVFKKLINNYNEQFTLSSQVWTKFIFETISIGSLGQTEQDFYLDCAIRCRISKDHCDFFTIVMGKCHLGRYSYYGQGIVADSSVPLTYHRSG